MSAGIAVAARAKTGVANMSRESKPSMDENGMRQRQKCRREFGFAIGWMEEGRDGVRKREMKVLFDCWQLQLRGVEDMHTLHGASISAGEKGCGKYARNRGMDPTGLHFCVHVTDRGGWCGLSRCVLSLCVHAKLLCRKVAMEDINTQC